MAPFSFLLLKKIMVVPFIALVAVIVAIVYFLVKAGKKKSEGKDLGEHGRAA
jgi:hypothetical protein